MRPPRNSTLFLATFSFLLLPVAVSAELMLRSDPEHVNVRVKGPVVVQGGTPLSLQDIPMGQYRLRVDGRGVAVTQGRLRLTQEGQLIAKPWAGADVVVLPPGLAHVVRGDRQRAWLFLGSSAGSSAMALFRGADSRDADADLRLSQLAYDRAQSTEAIASASASLQRASRKAKDALNVRNLWIGYFGTVWFWSATEAWLLTPRPRVQLTGENEYLIEVSPARSWSAIWRSALVPGSGQRYLGRASRANLFAAGVLLFGAGSIMAQESYLEANRELAHATARYRQAQTPEELLLSSQALWDASREVDNKNVIRWAFVGGTLGVYLWNILDASTGGYELPEPTRVGWGLSPQPGGFQATMSWRLP